MAYSSDVPGVTVAAGDDFCPAPTAESDPVVSFKPCGKKKTGIVMPCNGHPGFWRMPASNHLTPPGRRMSFNPSGSRRRA
ncbi:hypothetical protein N8D56_03195 [Devosia sp. A8/3-2]|nr:hypothetical protein N8D56_03195 [Devosia sp. A8/3-2]